jgi:hypothetical protein
MIEELEALCTGEPVQIRPIDFPRRPACMGVGFVINLLSVDDDELELITRHRASAS